MEWGILIKTDYQGYISAVGTASEPITFSGLGDDYWSGIYLADNGQENKLEHVQIQDGLQRTGIGVDDNGTRVPMIGNLVISGKAVLNNLSIVNSQYEEPVTNKPVSLRLEQSAEITEFSNNKFDKTISLTANNLNHLENSFELEGKIELTSLSSSSAPDTLILKDYGNTYTSRGEFYFRNNLLQFDKYVVFEYDHFEVDENSTVKMKEGSSIFINDKSAKFRGNLIANGTEQNPVKFTSSNQQKGSWVGMHLYGEKNQLNNVIVEFAGAVPNNNNLERANIGLYNGANLEISNSTIKNSSGWGIWVSSNSQLSDSSNTYENNSSGDIGYE